MNKKEEIIKRKKISTWKIKFSGYEHGGSLIEIFGNNILTKEFSLQDEIHFMYYINGLVEYHDLKLVSDIIDLMKRNS